MKRKKLIQLFSVALLGATILTGVNALPASSISGSALSNANTSSIESTTLSDISTEVNNSETTENTSLKEVESNNEAKITTNVKDSASAKSTSIKTLSNAKTSRIEATNLNNASAETTTTSEDTPSKEVESNTENKGPLSEGNETVHSGWVKNEDGKWNLYKDGKKVTGIYYYAPGAPLSFDENGVCSTGWTEINGKTYYFKETSTKVVAASSEVIDGRHLSATGSILTGLYSIRPGVTHCYDENGYECKGLTKINGKMYYFKETSDGYIMALNETIDGNYYNANGVCENISSDDSVNISVPKNGWEKSEDGKSYYYVNGTMIKGFHKTGPTGLYYFDKETGASAEGWTEINGKTYYFKPDADGYIAACNEYIDGRYINSDHVVDDSIVTKVKNADEAIKLIKENDSQYIASLESELGSLDLVDTNTNFNTPFYIYSSSFVFNEPAYNISVIQKDTNTKIGSYLVGSTTGKVYSFKDDFELAYEMNNNEIVSTAHRHHGPISEYNGAAWR